MDKRIRIAYRIQRRRGYDRATAWERAQLIAARLTAVFAIAKARGDL